MSEQTVQLAPHQQRVVDEKNELIEKIVKLDAFTQEGNAIFMSLNFEDRHLLVKQLIYMRQYLVVLEARVSRFN